MRASAHKSAHRNLASSKRSIVMVCAGLAMILGTTSVGASLFSSDDEILISERTVSNTFDRQSSSEEAAAANLNSQGLKTLKGQQIVISSPASKAPGITLKSADGSKSINLNLNKAPVAASIQSAIVDQIQSSNDAGPNTSTSGTTSETPTTDEPPASQEPTGDKPADPTPEDNSSNATPQPQPSDNGLQQLNTPEDSEEGQVL